MFVKSSEYWANRINRIESAIQSASEELETLTEQRQIDALEAHISTLKKSLAKAKFDYAGWRNKRQNIERGARYAGKKMG